MSASVMDHMIQYEKKPPGGPDYHSVENALLMQVSLYVIKNNFFANLIDLSELFTCVGIIIWILQLNF